MAGVTAGSTVFRIQKLLEPADLFLVWKLLVVALAGSLLAMGQGSPKISPQDAMRKAMEEAAQRQREATTAMEAPLTVQRASIRKQAAAANMEIQDRQDSFLDLPWPSPVAMLTGGLGCDPLPKDRLASLIDQTAQREGISSDLIRAVAGRESAFRPCVVSPKGAMGLMQLMPETQQYFHVTDPFDPGQNLTAGSRLLKQLLERYKGDLSLALSAYNAGAGRVDRAGGIPPIPETQHYVSGILDKLPGFR